MEFKEWIRAQWDRVAAGTAVAAGAVALALGWFGVRDAVYPGQQIPYVVSGGLVAVFLVGVGTVLWLSADLRDEWRKLDDIDEKLGRLVAARRPQSEDMATAIAGQPDVETLRAQLDALEHAGTAAPAAGAPASVADQSRPSRRRPLQRTG